MLLRKVLSLEQVINIHYFEEKNSSRLQVLVDWLHLSRLCSFFHRTSAYQKQGESLYTHVWNHNLSIDDSWRFSACFPHRNGLWISCECWRSITTIGPGQPVTLSPRQNESHSKRASLRNLAPMLGVAHAIPGGIIWVFLKIMVPQNGWFIRKNPIKMDDFGVPLFLETPI